MTNCLALFQSIGLVARCDLAYANARGWICQNSDVPVGASGPVAWWFFVDVGQVPPGEVTGRSHADSRMND
ncbi:hypothetical protein RE6C_00488 [Rhodopirellula europaea 6C]|uniref:Uncharacterized protein n=1 Tax=Rhodopirellula europaea 6C TaxID=1263867 RepID=M2B9F0_9BACT|nr:hypothetical protein RE6C_00488 [Rhodopirellula europaea 6C]